MQKQKVDQLQIPGAPRLAIGRCRAQLSVFQVIGHVVIWLIITTVTLGIGALFWPHAAARMILESIILTDETGHPSARMRCYKPLGALIGNAVLWRILILLTGGLAGLCYIFGVAHFAISRNELMAAE